MRKSSLVGVLIALSIIGVSGAQLASAEERVRGERGERESRESASLEVKSSSLPATSAKSAEKMGTMPLPALSAFEKVCAKMDAKRLTVPGLPNLFFCNNVTPPPPQTPTVDIGANPVSVLAGATSTLTWNSENATTCTASNGWSGSKTLDGSETVVVNATSTYTITCTGPGGSANDSVSVNVVPVTPTPSPSLILSGNPLTVMAGATSTLTWNSDNANSCVASNGWGGIKALDGLEIVTVNATSTYTLDCGNGVSTSTQSVTVNVTPIPPAPTLTFNGNPLNINQGATSTLSWASGNTTLCLASNGWSGTRVLSGSEIVSPSATTTYSLSCGGEGGTTTESVIIGVTPTPPTFGKVVLSELFYDVDTLHGIETSNEWVELYNGSTTPINVSGWRIWDSATSSSDVIPDGTIIPAGGFLILTASTTATSTESFWSIPLGVPVLMIGNASLGSNGFSNTGDALYLKDGETVVDSMSYGSNISVFDPSVPAVAEGHSLRRKNLETDTNTALDWEDKSIPTPGSF